jgi:peptide deformylase
MEFKPLEWNDKKLKDLSIPFDFRNREELNELLENMRNYLTDNELNVISAPQFGYNYHIMMLKMKDEDLLPIINPRIVDISKTEVFFKEGSVNFQGLMVKVKRPAIIKIRFKNPNEEVITSTFKDVDARCILMMLDTFFGRNSLDSANFLNKQKAIKEWNKILRLRKD